jgi:hypothetical protein
LEASILRIGSIGEWEVRAVHICVDVMVAYLILSAVTTNVVSDIGPRAQTINLSTLKQEKLLIRTPVRLEDRDGVLFDDLEGVCRRVVVLGALTSGEAGDTEVVFMTGRMRAGNSDLKDESQVSHLNLPIAFIV